MQEGLQVVKLEEAKRRLEILGVSGVPEFTYIIASALKEQLFIVHNVFDVEDIHYVVIRKDGSSFYSTAMTTIPRDRSISGKAAPVVLFEKDQVESED